MVYVVTAKRLIFSTACRFVTDQVGIGAADSGRTYSFVGVYHDFVVRSFLHCIQIMIVHPLSVVMFSTRNDITYITTLDSIVSVIYHKLISSIQMTFIVARGSRSFVMHHQLHSFCLRISIEHFQIEVGIRSNKIKNIIFGMAEPVLPTLIPTFHQYLVKSMQRRKVNITFHIVIIRSMPSVRLCL